MHISICIDSENPITADLSHEFKRYPADVEFEFVKQNSRIGLVDI